MSPNNNNNNNNNNNDRRERKKERKKVQLLSKATASSSSSSCQCHRYCYFFGPALIWLSNWQWLRRLPLMCPLLWLLPLVFLVGRNWWSNRGIWHTTALVFCHQHTHKLTFKGRLGRKNDQLYHSLLLYTETFWWNRRHVDDDDTSLLSWAPYLRTEQ